MSTRDRRRIVGSAIGLVLIVGASAWWAWEPAEGTDATDPSPRATAPTTQAPPGPTGDFGEAEEVIGPDDVSNLGIDVRATEATLEQAGADVVLIWQVGRDAASAVVVAVGNDVAEDDLRRAVATATNHADRFRFVRARYSSAELATYADRARLALTERGDDAIVNEQLVLDDLLDPGGFGALDAQPALWILVGPEDEADVRSLLEEVVPADSFVLDPIGVPVDIPG